jgi:hypothetical protein
MLHFSLQTPSCDFESFYNECVKRIFDNKIREDEHGSHPGETVMKLSKKSLGRLSLLLPVMMAVTSCGTMGNMQNMPKGQGSHHTKQSAHVSKHHHKTHVKSSSTTKLVKLVKIPQPVSYQQKSVLAHGVPITHANPVIGDMCILNVHGIDVKPQAYEKINGRTVVNNIHRLDVMDGNYHYIQAARWDGTHVDQTYINARTAELMSLIGLAMLENGYLETNFGTTIMVLGGNGHIVTIPGHQIDLVIRKANSGNHKANKIKSGKNPHQTKQVNPQSKKISHLHQKKFSQHHLAKVDTNDFYIMGGDVITVSSKQLKVTSIAMARSMITNKKVGSTSHHLHRVTSKHHGFSGLKNASLKMGISNPTERTILRALNVAPINHPIANINQEFVADNVMGGAAINHSTPVYTDSPLAGHQS